MTSKRWGLLLTVALAGCGPYFYKYKAPDSTEGMVPISVSFSGDPVVAQAAYFLEGATCSELRDLQPNDSPTKSVRVFAPTGQPASFHVVGTTSSSTSLGYSTSTVRLQQCFNDIVTFIPSANASYRLLYERNGDQCRVSLQEERSGTRQDATAALVRRTKFFGGSSTPSSSFCTDPWPHR